MPLWVSETELSSTYLHSWDFVILGDGGGSGSWKCVCLDFVALSKEAGENRPGDDKNLPHQGWGSHWILNNVVFLCNPNVLVWITLSRGGAGGATGWSARQNTTGVLENHQGEGQAGRGGSVQGAWEDGEKHIKSLWRWEKLKGTARCSCV